MTPRKRYSFFIDDELGAGLKVLKARDGMPESEAIRRALKEFLKRKGVTGKADRRRGPTRRQS